MLYQLSYSTSRRGSLFEAHIKASGKRWTIACHARTRHWRLFHFFPGGPNSKAAFTSPLAPTSTAAVRSPRIGCHAAMV